MTSELIRIADGRDRRTFRLTPQVAMFQRCCIASASDEGKAAAELNLPPTANHYCMGSREHRAWRDAYTRIRFEMGEPLGRIDEHLDAADQGRPAGPWVYELAAAFVALILIGCLVALYLAR